MSFDERMVLVIGIIGCFLMFFKGVLFFHVCIVFINKNGISSGNQS